MASAPAQAYNEWLWSGGPAADARGHARKRSAAAVTAAVAAADDADVTCTDVYVPPAKKGRRQTHGQAEDGKAPSAQSRASVYERTAQREFYLGSFGSEEEAARAHDRALIVVNGAEVKTNFPVSDYISELPQLRLMTREEVVAHVRRSGGVAPKAASSKYRGVDKRGNQWQASITFSGRNVYLGFYGTEKDAARVFDFAVLSLRGGGGKYDATNFDKGVYLGANGALPPVEAALPGLGHNRHSLVQKKLAAAMGAAGAEGAPDGGSDDGSGSKCKSNSDRSAGLAIPTRVHTRPGSTALGAQPSAVPVSSQ
ncbi:hypothetical protein FOA52_003591 [Chlamydomonas sp. UWO 241]|nr:hypothetical protein FOA52_003591 [Chlamydomonas sp. UWO 241]